MFIAAFFSFFLFFCVLFFSDKTIKLWKVSERDKRPEGYNLKDEEGRIKDISTVTSLQVTPPISASSISLSIQLTCQDVRAVMQHNWVSRYRWVCTCQIRSLAQWCICACVKIQVPFVETNSHTAAPV